MKFFFKEKVVRFVFLLHVELETRLIREKILGKKILVFQDFGESLRKGDFVGGLALLELLLLGQAVDFA